MRLVGKMRVLLVLVAITQVSCGGRALGGDNSTDSSADSAVVSDDGAVGNDGCTVGCSGEPVLLANEPYQVWFLAVDSTHVYWSTRVGELKKVPLAGGTSTLLYNGELRPEGIVLDSTHVYWVDPSGGVVMKSPKVGGAAIEVASGYPQFEFPIALDTTHVYWIQNPSSDSDFLLRAPLDGGVPTVVLEVADSILGLAIDATHAYLICRYSGSVIKVPLDGGATEEIVSGDINPFLLAVDSSRAYWIGGNGSVVKSAPLSGGASIVLAESAFTNLDSSSWGTLHRLVIDDTHVYWTGYGVALVGAVSKVPLDGGSTTVLATGEYRPYALAVDSTHVYWTNRCTDGGCYLMKVPK